MVVTEIFSATLELDLVIMGVLELAHIERLVFQNLNILIYNFFRCPLLLLLLSLILLNDLESAEVAHDALLCCELSILRGRE